MKILEERILKDGQVLGEKYFKVDSFLTHQVDFKLMKEMGQVLAEAYRSKQITKVVTIRYPGIAPAVYVAESLDVPMIFAKNIKILHDDRRNLDIQVSFTKQVVPFLLLGKFLSPEDRGSNR